MILLRREGVVKASDADPVPEEVLSALIRPDRRLLACSTTLGVTQLETLEQKPKPKLAVRQGAILSNSPDKL
jgi:hypothetical protein